MQAKDSLWVAGPLAAAGGYLDAFTYIGHGHVFANAMTGNVVLLGAFAAAGNWREALRYSLPILAFLAGVAAAQMLRLPRVSALVPEPAIASLAVEIGFLFAAGWAPASAPDLPLVLGISFLAALQSSTFPRLEKWSYNSTMTTGNLRQFGEAAFAAIFLPRDAEVLRRTRLFAIISLSFLGGAVVGGIFTALLNNRALWIGDLVLLCAWIPLAVSNRRAKRATAARG